MLGEFIEASVNFQNETIYLMYLVLIIGVFGTAFIMFLSANKKDKS